MFQILEEYEDYLVQVKQSSENTVSSYMRDLRQFAAYLQELNIAILDADHDVVSGYVSYLIDKGKSSATVSRCIASLKSMYAFAISRGQKEGNPVIGIHVEKAEKKLPQILTGKEVELLLEQPKCTDLKGYRDKAMLELLYATGIRVSELINLDVSDVNIPGGFIKCGTGGKVRIIPLYPAAIRALNDYIESVRPKMATNTDTQRITTLDHKIINDTMECQTIIIALGSQCQEINNGFRCCFREKLDLDIAVILNCHNGDGLTRFSRSILDLLTGFLDLNTGIGLQSI